MTNLMIADDEKIVIKALKFIINANFPDKFEIFPARSGREAILIAEQTCIDIAFIDMSMPGINGIQTIKRLREIHPEMVCIVLSAHDKFDYAVNAMHLGVLDYLLKPINREQIIEVLFTARLEIEKNKNRRLQEVDMSERLDKAKRMMEKELVSSAISWRSDMPSLEEHKRVLGIERLCGFCLLLEFDNSFLERNGVFHGQGEAIGSDYYTVCEQIKSVGLYLVGSLLSNRIAVFRILDSPAEEERVLAEAEKIRDKLAGYVGAKVMIGVGSYLPDIDKASDSYFAAVLALQFADLQTPVVSYQQIKDRPAEEAAQKESGVSKPIQQAVAYIDRHYDHNLTLNFMAGIVNMSPNYFSKLFKEEAGDNFIDYLTRIRIDRAKKILLENKCSIKEVSLAVGYRDSGYFTRIFKKVTGVVPSDYV